MKRILLVNPGVIECGVPHSGLAMISSVLQQKGYTIKVADYHFSRQTPKIEEILDNFKPDVVGISLFSCIMSAASNIIDTIKNRNIPLICGGPHTASYYEELSSDTRFDYVVIGEAEDAILKLVEGSPAIKNPPLVFRCPLPDINRLPFPDYTSFYNYRDIKLYPLITSRGCPFNCSFCSIGTSNSKIWRARTPESCFEELKEIAEKLPFVKEVMIWDDNFSLDTKRAKSFLQMFLKEKFGYKLRLANVRADKIDEEFLMLLKEADCKEIQFGVEHGDPDVFRHIGKGESLRDIKKAAELVNANKMKLGCSFIIGLPHDNLSRTFNSIKFAKELKPDHIHWNILVPYKGTGVYKYFKENGQIDDNSIPFTIPQDVLSFEPNADTPYFTREERKKAYLMALLLSGDPLLIQNIKKTFFKALEYNLIKEFLQWFFNPVTLKGLAWIAKEHILGWKK